MRKIKLLPALLIAVFAACNSGTNNNNSTDSTTTAMSDTMHHNMSTEGAPTMETPPADAKVYFVTPKNNETVKPQFKVVMAVDGMAVDTAGSMQAGTGHHHLLIDAGDSIPAGQVVPKDSTHLHFGKGQKETTITLPEGKHTLTLQFADGLHRSYGGKLATTITVNVKK